MSSGTFLQRALFVLIVLAQGVIQGIPQLLCWSVRRPSHSVPAVHSTALRDARQHTVVVPQPAVHLEVFEALQQPTVVESIRVVKVVICARNNSTAQHSTALLCSANPLHLSLALCLLPVRPTQQSNQALIYHVVAARALPLCACCMSSAQPLGAAASSFIALLANASCAFSPCHIARSPSTQPCALVGRL